MNTKKNESLYTAKDVQKVRDELLKKQKGIDPITKEKLVTGASVALDHSHSTQHCRAALHRNSNAWEGLVYNAYKQCLQWSTDVPLPELLRNLALYYEQDYSSNPYHNGWLKRVQIDYKKLSAQQQNEVLVELGSKQGSNATERLKLFKVKIQDRAFGYDIIRNILTNTKDTNA